MFEFPEIITLGECMALAYPLEPVSLFQTNFLKLDMAGAESNLSIALARLGHRVRFITRVGLDPFGERIKAVLSDENVMTDGIIQDSRHPTGLFFREWLEDGRRRVYYYRKDSAASHLSEGDLKPEWFEGVKLLHLTGITPALSPNCLKACMKAIELARQNKLVISFDPNYRSPLWDTKTARQVLLPFMELVDMVLLGHEDGYALFDQKDDYSILQDTKKLGPKICILKMAERGALIHINDDFIEVPAYPIVKVIDPVGAGDGFDAGFISGYLRGWDIKTSVELGAKIGALAVTVMGDYHGYPLEQQI